MHTAPRTRPSRRRTPRRNRKRPSPLWRRLPPRVLARGVGRLLRRGVPALVALGVVAVVIGGLALGYRFITGSPRFAVSHVDIRGNHRLSDAHIRALLGIDDGQNIFRVDLADLPARLEAEPWIARAAVRRELPGTLVIELEEHVPAAVVELDGLYLADADGAVFMRASTARDEGAGLPVITGIPRDEYGRAPDRAQARIRDALAAARAYEGALSPAEAVLGVALPGVGAIAPAPTGDGAGRPPLGEVPLDPRRGVVFVTYDAALAIRVGAGSLSDVRTRLRAFDAAWAALTPRERDAARVVYADQSTRTDRVTVGF